MFTGVPLMDGGTVRLPQLIGLSRAMDMILTGRPVDAEEAFTIGKHIQIYGMFSSATVLYTCVVGLANRLVPRGQALSEAKMLAKSLQSFPKLCLRQDLQSARYCAFADITLQERLRKEFEGGREVLEKESVAGAQQFSSGKGRSGTFNS